MNIRRFIPVAVLVAGGLGIAACSSGTTAAPKAPETHVAPAPAPAPAVAPAPTPAPTVAPTPAPAPTAPTPTTAPAPSTDSQTLYLDAVNSFGGDFNNVSDPDLLTLGNAVCSDFNNGASPSAVAQDAISAQAANPQAGLTVADFGIIIGAATGPGSLCPTYGPAVQAWSNSVSGSSA